MTDGVLLEVEIPGEFAECVWPNSRCHWGMKAAHARRMRDLARIWTRQVTPHEDYRLPAEVPLSVQWTIVLGKGKRQRDIDNTIAACKPLMDGIFDVLEADDKRVTQVGVRWERGTESGIKCRIASLGTRG